MKKLLLALIPILFIGASPIQYNAYDYVPEETFRVICPFEFDLRGIQTTYPLYVPIALPVVWGNTANNVQLLFSRLFIVYSEATSADAGIQIRVGVPSNNYYYTTYTTAQSATLWQVDTLDASNFDGESRVFNDGTNNVILVTCMGGKKGTGKVMIGAEFSRNITERKK